MAGHSGAGATLANMTNEAARGLLPPGARGRPPGGLNSGDDDGGFTRRRPNCGIEGEGAFAAGEFGPGGKLMSLLRRILPFHISGTLAGATPRCVVARRVIAGS